MKCEEFECAPECAWLLREASRIHICESDEMRMLLPATVFEYSLLVIFDAMELGLRNRGYEFDFPAVVELPLQALGAPEDLEAVDSFILSIGGIDVIERVYVLRDHLAKDSFGCRVDASLAILVVLRCALLYVFAPAELERMDVVRKIGGRGGE